MKEKLIRSSFILAVGTVLSGNVIMGIQSIGAIFFIAAFTEGIHRWLLFPFVLAAMSFHMTVDQLIKYGVGMIITMLIVIAGEKKWKRFHKEWGYICMGGTLIAIAAGERWVKEGGNYFLIKGIVEGVFVMSSGYLLGMFIHLLMSVKVKKPKLKKNKEQWFLANAGKARLLACAETYRNLAKTFHGLSETPPDEFLMAEERKDYLWKRRMMETQVVMAGQLSEMAQIITDVAEDICGVVDVGEMLEERLTFNLKKKGILAKNILVAKVREQRNEIYMTVRTYKRKPINTKEIGDMLYEVCNKKYVPSLDTVTMVNKEFVTLRFEEDANFRLLSGLAKVTKENERISGDNYSIHQINTGRIVCSLSDGMGSGEEAYEESETVVDLMEQFLEAGFTKEAAIQMVNGYLISRTEDQVISTADICDIDLYDGVCDFMKLGASTSFIKRDNGVEIVPSQSLPLGVFHQLDLESVSKKLYDGDYVIMMTDGVVDRILETDPEEELKELIQNIQSVNPNEMAKQILYQILASYPESIHDDMTVIVLGIWKK